MLLTIDGFDDHLMNALMPNFGQMMSSRMICVMVTRFSNLFTSLIMHSDIMKNEISSYTGQFSGGHLKIGLCLKRQMFLRFF